MSQRVPLGRTITPLGPHFTCACVAGMVASGANDWFSTRASGPCDESGDSLLHVKTRVMCQAVLHPSCRWWRRMTPPGSWVQRCCTGRRCRAGDAAVTILCAITSFLLARRFLSALAEPGFNSWALRGLLLRSD
jgi:hypothetical protein